MVKKNEKYYATATSSQERRRIGQKEFEMYSNATQQCISREFPSLRGNCYLDHAGATLYSKTQINSVFKELNETLFANPHSLSLSSRYTLDIIDQVRYRVLSHFHTNPDEYSIIFTSGATAALKLLGESFIWGENTFNLTSKNKEDSARITSKIINSNARFQNGKACLRTCNCNLKAPLVMASGREEHGTFVYLQDNHTSVLGLRELAEAKGACIHYIPHDLAFTTFEKNKVNSQTPNLPAETNSLFVYPAQCNFSGVKYPLNWIAKVQEGVLNCCPSTKWYCCLDAASYVSTSDLDLSAVKPDFVCISFYKMFGYPTGLGALLVRRSSENVLERNYFGGGTVQISLSAEKFHVLRPSLSERFEDGTLPFLSIAALRHGFDNLRSLPGGMTSVSSHTLFLARYVHHSLLLMHHSNDSPAVVLYCDTDYENPSTQGSIVNFNLLRSNGEYVGFAEVLHMANLYGIHLRTGCFCNPGACQRHLNFSTDDVKSHYEAGHICGDEIDLINGKPTGSIRISFGYMSTKENADQFLDMIIACFVDSPVKMCLPGWWTIFCRKYREKFRIQNDINVFNAEAINKTDCVVKINGQVFETRKKPKSSIHEDILHRNKMKSNRNELDDIHLSTKANHSFNISPKGSNLMIKSEKCYNLTNIYVYPVKSCGPMSVQKWEINFQGLKYDREWMIVGQSGIALTQKQETKLCLVMPIVDLEQQCLTLQFEGVSPVSVSLKNTTLAGEGGYREATLCESKVCGDHVVGWDCGEEVAGWLCSTLGRQGLRLMRQGNAKTRTSKSISKHKKSSMKSDQPVAAISLANQAQFLLVNSASVLWLKEQLKNTEYSADNLLRRFRSNFVIEGLKAFEENSWTKLSISKYEFLVEGPCTRCQMVCVDQTTGEKSKEPLRSLAEAFHGKMSFGIYLRQKEDTCKTISTGNHVKIM